MDEKRRTIPKLSFDIILILVFLIVPMVPYLNWILHGAVFTWPVFILWLAVIATKKRQFLQFLVNLKKRRKYLFLIGLFIVVIIVNYFFVRTNEKALTYIASFINFMLIFIIDTYYSTKSLIYKFSILFYLVLLLAIPAAVSIPYLLSSGGEYITRMLANGSLSLEAAQEAMEHGVGNNGIYTSVGAIAFLGLSICGHFKPLYRIILLIGSIILLFSVMISTFLASILMIVVGGVILFVRFYKRLVDFKLLFSVSVVFVSLIYFFYRYVDNTNLLKPVILKINNYIQFGGDVTGRGWRAESSIRTFSDNPFWGVGVPPNGSYDIIGEHMPWVDYLGNFGLLGFLPLVMFLFLVIKKSLKSYFINDYFKFYRTGCLIGTIIFILSNFISPMMTVPNMVFMLILYYTSLGNVHTSLRIQRSEK